MVLLVIKHSHSVFSIKSYKKWRQNDVIMTSKSNFSNFLLHIMIPHKNSLKIGQVIFIHSEKKKNFYDNIYIFLCQNGQNDPKWRNFYVKIDENDVKINFSKKNLHFWIPRKISLKIGWVIFIHGAKIFFFMKKRAFFGVFPLFP